MTDDCKIYESGEEHTARSLENNFTGESAVELSTEISVTATSFKSLFRHASKLDILLHCVGFCSAVIGGMVMPFVFYIYGYIANGFVCYSMISNSTYNVSVPHITKDNVSTGNIIPSGCAGISEDTFLSDMRNYAGAFAGFGALQLIAGYGAMTTLSISANNQLFRVQCLFLKSFLRQDMAWFDNHRAGEFASRAVNDLQRFKDGIGDKIGMVTYYMSMFIGCVIMSLAQGWQLTLVILAASPLTIASGAMAVKVQSSFAIEAMKAYATAGNVAEEVISSIRTVFAFGGEAKEIERYQKYLINARRAGIKSGIVGGVSAGTNYMVIFFIYALSLWYGIKLILQDRQMETPDYTPQNVSAIFINLIFGTYYIGQISPHLEVISTARSAITFVYEVIDRIPPIDSSSEGGLRVKIDGNITFHNIHFEYPSRPGMKILQGFDVEIKRGETVALVGESGCGKSTVLQLLQRYYDPLQGVVKIDGTDLRLLNVGWLRDHIGVVGQEPVLFEASIFDNIKFGKEDAEIEDIIKAAQQANVHSFVSQLPQQYNTLVGERGAQLSGGQKQRIAIARALVRNPKILLLDEATSALDSESETLVQNALDNASHGRTTIIIAHRLTTVRNANKIIVISKGKLREIGTHDELMSIQGVYYDLVVRQTKGSDVEERTNDNYEKTAEPVLHKNGFNASKKSEYANSARRSSHNKSFRSKFIPEDENIADNDVLSRPSIVRLLRINSSEWYILLFGALGSLIMGLMMPSYSIIFGKMFGVMSIPDPQEATDQSEYYAVAFIIIGSIVFAGKFLEVAMFSISGEILTWRIRKLTFSSILRQEVAWFDDPLNGTGALCSRLAGDAANVQAAARSCSEAMMQSVVAIIATIIMNLILEWRLGLVALAFIPLIVTGYFLEKEAIYSKSLDEMKAYEKANQKAVEAISNIKTVASLHREKKVLKSYRMEIEIPYKNSLRSAHVHGIMFGVSQCTLSFANAAVFYYGSVLFHSGEIPYETVLIISELMIASSFVIGQVMSFAPNYNKALISAARVFQLSDRNPKIDSSYSGGISLNCNEELQIEFRNVHFSYPTRPNMKILQGLNLAIPPGKKSALVGSSGCGKSTCIQLLQRFYDSNRGQLVINNNDIRSLNISALRSCIGIVSQEPVLFDKNIAENIAYGDNSRIIPMDEIIKAAASANIHHFITTLPEGYNTNVGARGLQLSGGQKQRIAIARALLRNPKILLLDEATSALDAENEAIVQKTLEEVQKGRTCITIAHRLTTIQNSDRIFVLHKGHVAEMGTHEQLMEQRGYYYKFHQA